MSHNNSKNIYRTHRNRHRKTVSIMVAVSILCGLIIAFLIVWLVHMKKNEYYVSVNTSDLFSQEMLGFDTQGRIVVSVNNGAVDEMLLKAKEGYAATSLHKYEVQDEDYFNFRNSLACNVSVEDGLSNGEQVMLTYSYNRELADKLRIDISDTPLMYMVENLPSATFWSLDDLFAKANVTFSGISPNIEVTVENSDPENVDFAIVNQQSAYADGDVLTLQAVFDENLLKEKMIVVEADAQECVREYPVTCDRHYLRSVSELPDSVIDAAIEAGRQAFVNANEYGVRIFCEGHLVPIYVNKQATFQWGTPNLLEVYFKSVLEDYAGNDGNNFNDLDIVYSVNISQADGTACKAYAAVRFSDISIDDAGVLSYDFSNPKIMSASYFESRVIKNVDNNYENTYSVNRVR